MCLAGSSHLPNFLNAFHDFFFATGCKPDATEPNLCYEASINTCCSPKYELPQLEVRIRLRVRLTEVSFDSRARSSLMQYECLS